MFLKKLISLLVIVVIVCAGSLLFSPVFASNESFAPASSPDGTELQEQIVHLQEALQMYENTATKYIPIRLVAESLGYKVIWNNVHKIIDVFTVGTPSKKGQHVAQFIQGEYVIHENRAYIPIASILRLSDEKTFISYIGDVGFFIYRSWVPIGTEGLVEEQFTERTIDNDSCQVVLYSDGDDQHPGGAITKRIRVSIKSRTF